MIMDKETHDRFWQATLTELKRGLPDGLYGMYVDRVIPLEYDSEPDQPPL
jgi:hypothetical protein